MTQEEPVRRYQGALIPVRPIAQSSVNIAELRDAILAEARCYFETYREAGLSAYALLGPLLPMIDLARSKRDGVIIAGRGVRAHEDRMQFVSAAALNHLTRMAESLAKLAAALPQDQLHRTLEEVRYGAWLHQKVRQLTWREAVHEEFRSFVRAMYQGDERALRTAWGEKARTQPAGQPLTFDTVPYPTASEEALKKLPERQREDIVAFRNKRFTQQGEPPRDDADDTTVTE